ncbi:MAG TPA: FtsX-like permease family protein [Thermoanaerobaculia bacterium]|nr:FtsX-like permease family protein [Thermoanaerobaculia bacterium]
MNAAFAPRYASRNLLRGGQRTLLATACVGFGVMSVVGLQLLSSMIAASIALDPRFVLGGDASLSRGDRALTAGDVEEIERMRAHGTIAAYTLTTPGEGALLQHGSGPSYVLGRALGVDPATFPLVGDVRLGNAAAGFGRLIAEPGTAVITRDVADKMGLAAGDEFTLGGGPQGAPARLRVAGIAELTPDRQGDTVLYSLATARKLAGREDVAGSAQVLWGKAPPTPKTLAAAGWTVTSSAEIAKKRARVVDLFGMMLKGAGLLGLLLGGIGMANTMQVLLARRKLEIATLKTLGYERGHLVLLFGLETGMLGVIGGLIGAAAGAGLSYWLRLLLGRVGPIMLGTAIDPRVLAGGVATGIATAVIFGLYAIVRASAVRPSTLLRDLPVPKAWGEAAVLYAALGALFSALAAMIMGSVLYGVGVVAAGVAGLVLLMMLLGAGFFAVVAVPLPLSSLVALARRNLRRQPVQTLVALVALFCGVFTIGFAAATISNGRHRLATQELPSGGYNVTVYTSQASAGRVSSLLEREGVKEVERFMTAPVIAPQIPVLRVVTGCDGDRTGTVRIVDGAWEKKVGTALAPARLRGEPWRLTKGGVIELSSPAGERARVSITGFYDLNRVSPLVPRLAGLIVDQETALRLGGQGAQVNFTGRVEERQLGELAQALQRGAPDAVVLSRADLESAMQGIIENLFAFVVAIAGLALVAGGVLIANSVGLAMLDRRREMGIFKAIGYSSARILTGIAIEYALLGLVAGIAGMGAVALAFRVIDHLRPAAQLALDPMQAPVMIAVAMAIAFASALAVAWRPTHARPLEVLRQEG